MENIKKNWWLYLLIIAVIGLLIYIGYKWYNYSKCKDEEGNACSDITLRTTQPPNQSTPTPINFTTTCSFFKGKGCGTDEEKRAYEIQQATQGRG